MTKPSAPALRGHKTIMANMIATFRRDLDEPFALIGKATCATLQAGEAVTVATLEPRIRALARRPALADMAMGHLEHQPPTSAS